MGNNSNKDGVLLTDFEIETIMSNTGFSRNQIIKYHESFIKEYPDGILTRKKFTDVYKKFYPDGKYSDEIFDVYDM